MNFFSSNAFLESLIEARFTGRRCEIGDYTLDGRIYRLLSVDGQPVVEWPFLDFFEAREPNEPAEGTAKRIRYLPRAAVRLEACAGVKPESIQEGQQVAPLIHWSRFSTWEDFLKHVAKNRSRLWSDSVKRVRKLETEVGPVQFAYDEPTDEVFETCRDWKSAQYISTGGTDKFFRDNLGLFQGLRQRKVLVMSTLRAGKSLLAVSWSAFLKGRLSYWVPAYDSRYSTFSPGRLLFHRVMEASHSLGHNELDLLIGNEEYKWHYASDTRVVDAVGSPSYVLRLKKELKIQAKQALAPFPKVLQAARTLKRRFAR